MQIQENTFAEACFDMNSIAELQTALTSPADSTDMKQWDISETEYFNQIQLALNALRENTIDLNDDSLSVTTIQFFDYTHEVEFGENDSETITEYSANIVINEKLVIQLSGKGDEAHKPSIPSAVECHYNNKALQDWAAENLDIDDVIKFLDEKGIENNFYFLSENGEKIN